MLKWQSHLIKICSLLKIIINKNLFLKNFKLIFKRVKKNHLINTIYINYFFQLSGPELPKS